MLDQIFTGGGVNIQTASAASYLSSAAAPTTLGAILTPKVLEATLFAVAGVTDIADAGYDAALKKNYYITTIAAVLSKELLKNPFKKFMKFFPVIEFIYPSIYDHHVIAIKNKIKPSILTYNGAGNQLTKKNRIESLARIPRMPSYHRDEYPYASHNPRWL